MNKHITENLENYLNLSDPQYAILLTGEWGSGKTYFIDDFIKDKDSDNRQFIKISLFGMKNTSQIDDEILINLHPKLASKPARLVGNLLKSLLKVNMKYDSDNDDNSDGTITFNTSEFNLLEYFNGSNTKKKKELIFIFDDLERTDIPLVEILGYINYLVEQLSEKVIILANEFKINEDNKYLEFKEKVIGKTFQVTHDFDSVFKHFTTFASKSQKILEKNKETIHSVFDKAKYKNLRHLRQAILDLEYLYGYIDKKYKKHDVFMREFITMFFAFSFEIKKGNLKKEDFGKSESKVSYDISNGKINQSEFNEKIREIEKSDEVYKNILDKYSLLNFVDTLDFLKDCLYSGKIDSDEVNQQIAQTSYFLDETTPSWQRLWYRYSIEDDEFKDLITDVETKFYNNEYIEYGQLLHVSALLLFYSKEGFYEKDEKSIVIQAKKNIDKLRTSEELWKKRPYKYNGFGSYNLSFTDEKSDNFKTVLVYIEKKSNEAFDTDMFNKAKEVLSVFDDFEMLNQKLYKDFNNIPIFSSMSIDDFISKIISIEHKENQLFNIIHSLKARYEFNRYDLSDELDFWKEVDEKILNSLDKKEQPITYLLINYVFKGFVLKMIIENLEIK